MEQPISAFSAYKETSVFTGCNDTIANGDISGKLTRRRKKLKAFRRNQRMEKHKKKKQNMVPEYDKNIETSKQKKKVVSSPASAAVDSNCVLNDDTKLKKTNMKSKGLDKNPVMTKRNINTDDDNTSPIMNEHKETIGRVQESNLKDHTSAGPSDILCEVKNGTKLFTSASKAFKWLIHPLVPKDFIEKTFEKRTVYVERHQSDYYSHLMSIQGIDYMLRTCNIQFTKNLDLTTYKDGVKTIHNQVGRAVPSVVWPCFQDEGCSVRLLNPQTFFPPLWNLNSMLQEQFGCFVGANAYLTPPNTQGFAPHYDDIEAFILQLEGQKEWNLYSPRSDPETLPRFSSGDFCPSEIGKPFLNVTLKPGDLLYFPRGTIHQAKAVGDQHSLHITISTHQKNSWGDLLEKLVPAALKLACDNDIEFRKGLPMDYLDYMGLARSEETNMQRTQFVNKVKDLVGRLMNDLPIDEAVDEMARRFIRDALPPYINQDDVNGCVFGNAHVMTNTGVLRNKISITGKSRIKMVSKYGLRILPLPDEIPEQEDFLRIYFTSFNSLEYHGEEEQFFDVNDICAPGIEFLMTSYPRYVAVSELPIADNQLKIDLAQDLWEHGLLIIMPPDKNAPT